MSGTDVNQRRKARGESRRSREATWDWHKHYRIWDAGRKIFLYPENWLESEPIPTVVQCLAVALRRDLYRVDLTSIVSKYISETEKNLKRVFDAADKRSALLFFVEATALFGKRTEIKDSHDHDADTAGNYFLQRMERYRGPAILATGSRRRVDDAFFRTFDFSIRIRPGRKRRRGFCS